MNRQIIATEDGSHTLWVPELDEHFHSTHGAIQESLHVFIKNGLQKTLSDQSIVIFEVGFGTGLNALLTLLHAENRKIHYISIEKYPLTAGEYEQLNYCEHLDDNWHRLFLQMHQCEWNKPVQITNNFTLEKISGDLTQTQFDKLPFFNLIYFDAFAPGKQNEMWEESILKKLADHTVNGGHFSTYCAQGEVRRRLIRSGFQMHRIPGPPGKREMLTGEKVPET